MSKKPTYEELEQRVKELEKESVERKLAEEEAAESERKFRELAESLSELVYRAEPKTFVATYINKAVESFYGYTVNKWLEDPSLWESLIHPDDKEKVLAEFTEAQRMMENKVIEYRIIRKDNTIRWVEDHVSWEKDQTGTAVSMNGVMYDSTHRKQAEIEIRKAYDELEQKVEERTLELTKANEELKREIGERKRGEEALRESEEKYRTMMESMKAAVYICSPDFRVEYMNSAMIKRTGLDAAGELCHKAIHDLEERCPWCAHDKIQQGASAETEILSPKDNRYYNVSHSPIFFQDGSISKMTIYRDITERKQAEEERVRLGTAIEQASESIIIADGPGTIQYINPAFEKLSGFNREEIIGQNFRILKSDKHDEAFYREMYNIISRGHTWEGRIINTMKDGTLREFETRISPVKDSSGEIINFVSVNRDVTQEKALEAQLQHTQRMDAIGTLAGGIAHDFNNILSSVIGFTEIALYDAEKGTLQYENLQEVLVAGSRARDLVLQILTFSRQSDQEQKPVNVQLIAKDALRLLRASIPSTIEIKQNIQSEALVMGDSTQIHQVLMNLCTNAAHAMDDKGGVLTVDLVDIELDSEFISYCPDLKPGTYINLTVTDTGYGMAPDVLDKMFDPFFTTKGKGKGTGMGLSVVHGIVHSHGGSIYAYSECIGSKESGQI